MDQPLHVAITLEQFWHRVPGGTATAIWDMTRALAERDLEPTGVSAWHKTKPPSRFHLPIPIEWLPLPRTLLYESWHRFRAPKVQVATGAVDVIHATTLAIPPKSAPLVVTIHDLAFLHSPEHFTPRGNHFFNRGLDLARRDATLVVCPSEVTAEDCRRNGFSDERVRVVEWGVSSTRATEAEVARVRADHSIESPYILWTGTVEPRKNLGRLVEAFLSMDIEETLVLAGPEGWNEDLEGLMERAGDRVRALGFVAPETLRALYAGAKVFCYPSLFEGYGLPVIEAMAQGTPVVTSRATATEEAAGGAAILVDPTDVASIRAGIEQVLADETLQHRLGAAGQAHAATLTWDKCAQQMHAIYSEVAR